jgi:hypothetical protein
MASAADRTPGRRFIMLRVLLLILLLFPLPGCRWKWAYEVHQLERLFPLLESYQLQGYRNHDWCRVLEYRHGAFASDSSLNCTYVAQAATVPFDSEAERDFQSIRRAIAVTGVRVSIISQLVYKEGHLVGAEFDSSWGFTRSRYVFAPGAELPEDLPNEMEFRRIDENWYHVWEDWN